VAKMQSPQSVEEDLAGLEAWEIQALGPHGIPVLERVQQLKHQARRLAGRNDARSYLLLFEERLLNELIVDITSAYLDMERVARHIHEGEYKVGQTGTDFYRAMVR
jgi:hypothetical protein